MPKLSLAKQVSYANERIEQLESELAEWQDKYFNSKKKFDGFQEIISKLTVQLKDAHDDYKTAVNERRQAEKRLARALGWIDRANNSNPGGTIEGPQQDETFTSKTGGGMTFFGGGGN